METIELTARVWCRCNAQVPVPLMSSDDPQPLDCPACGERIFEALRQGPLVPIPVEFWERLDARRWRQLAVLFVGLAALWLAILAVALCAGAA